MYKFIDNQLNFSDFTQPVGMNLNAQNRWVKKAEHIPWEEIKKRYAKLFVNKKGNVAKPLRLALGALIFRMSKVIPMKRLSFKYRRQLICNFSADTKLMMTAKFRLTRR